MTKEQKNKIKEIFSDDNIIFNEKLNNCEVKAEHITKEQITELLKCDFVKVFDMSSYSDIKCDDYDDFYAVGHIVLEIVFTD